jgi:predicted nucleic acid-binding protein
MRLVLDTNVVLAGLLWGGPPRRLLERSIDGQVELFCCRSPCLKC